MRSISQRVVVVLVVLVVLVALVVLVVLQPSAKLTNFHPPNLCETNALARGMLAARPSKLAATGNAAAEGGPGACGRVLAWAPSPAKDAFNFAEGCSSTSST